MQPRSCLLKSCFHRLSLSFMCSLVVSRVPEIDYTGPAEYPSHSFFGTCVHWLRGNCACHNFPNHPDPIHVMDGELMDLFGLFVNSSMNGICTYVSNGVMFDPLYI